MLGSTVFICAALSSTVSHGAPALNLPLPDVVVEVRARPPSVLPDPTASRTVIDRARMERARREGAEASELVDAVAGARVFELGGPLAERRLSVRGGGFDETLVIVDGVPLSSPFATGLDVDLYGLDALESIELVKGGAGATLGDGAFAGALLLTTRRPRASAPFGAVSLSYGAFETLRASASGAAGPGAIAASFERTRGDFLYVSSLPALPDRVERRDNADASKGAVSGFASASSGETRFSFAFGGGVREGGVPGLETQEQRFARESRRTAHLRARVSRSFEDPPRAREEEAKIVSRSVELALDDADARAANFVRDTSPRDPDRHSANFEGALCDSDARSASSVEDAPKTILFEGGVAASFLDIDYRDERPELEVRSRTKFAAADADARLSFAANETNFIRLALTFGGDGSASTIHGDPRRIRAGAAISDALTLGDLTLFAALRGDKIGDARPYVLPRAGASWRASEHLSFHAGAGRSLRSPTIDELYHPEEVGFSGNPDLVAETAWEAELGTKLVPFATSSSGSAKLELGATFFARHVEDGILYLNRNAFTVRPENFGDARLAGGELEAAVSGRVFGFDATLDLAGTLLVSRLIESTGALPSRPPWGFAGGASIEREDVFGLHAIALSTAVRALAPTWANLQATLPIELYARWDAALAVAPSEATSIAVSVTNLLDDRSLESLHKLPLPGRAVFFTLRVASDGGRS